MTGKIIRFPAGRGGAFVHENDESYYLQIELSNDHAVLLNCSKTGEAPRVTLWRGEGESDFSHTTLDRFRWFCDVAIGKKSWAETIRPQRVPPDPPCA
jgi:hypothetical protein